MDKIILIEANRELENCAVEYKQEHFNHGESIINGSEMWDKSDNYNKWLERVSKSSNPITDVFFAVRENDKKMVGIICLRHELNDFFKDFGHIGYSVRPSERRKGYATEMLRQILIIANQIGLQQVQLSCENDNIPSVRTILKNGGIYERSYQYRENPADVFIVRL